MRTVTIRAIAPDKDVAARALNAFRAQYGAALKSDRVNPIGGGSRCWIEVSVEVADDVTHLPYPTDPGLTEPHVTHPIGTKAIVLAPPGK